MSYFPSDIPYMSEKELLENGIKIPKKGRERGMNENLADEIRKTIESVKDMKAQVGGINSYLSILEGLARADLQKQTEEAYQRGLDDAWEAARKIECDEGIDMLTLRDIFRKGSSTSIIRDFSASEAIAKLKAYEEEQAAEVVRCKDCRHFKPPYGCSLTDGLATAYERGFCCYGERIGSAGWRRRGMNENFADEFGKALERAIEESNRAAAQKKIDGESFDLLLRRADRINRMKGVGE